MLKRSSSAGVSYIQIRMFADRLEIQSPGGLFGNVTLENIEEEHSTRNARLMRIMEDMHLVENRGSGIKAMLHAMRDANLEPPRFDDRRSSFRVVFMNHTLINPEAVAWLNQFRGVHLDDRQRLALVYLRHRDAITNSEYRRLTHVDALAAGQELRGLVQAGLVEQRGAGRWTTYALKPPEAGPGVTGEVIHEDGTKSALSRRQVEAQEAQVEAQRAQVDLTTVEKSILGSCKDVPRTGQELVRASGYATRTGNFKRSLEKLLIVGFIEMTIPDKPRSSRQKYRLTERGRQLLKQMEEDS